MKLSQIICIAFLVLGLCNLESLALTDQPAKVKTDDLQMQGEELLKSMAKVNSYWLSGPSEKIKNYSYGFTLGDKSKIYTVENPCRSGRSFRQGISYYSVLHKLISDPSEANITVIEEGVKVIRLNFAFKGAMKCSIGNGVSGSWIGYFNRRIDAGSVWMDMEKMVPVRLVAGEIEERFSDYVKVDQDHYVPLSIKIDKEEIHFSWKFAFYEPGLWLFDMAKYQYGEGENRLVASIRNVVINAEDGKVSQLPMVPVDQSDESVSLKRILSEGRKQMETVIQTNNCWLLPSLKLRKGLLYRYRQEQPYQETVVFGNQGNIMAQLDSCNESPDEPTRQKYYLSDGTSGNCKHDDEFLRSVNNSGDKKNNGKSLVQNDRYLNNLATGLNFDCAVTIMARNPEMFYAKYEAIDDNTYQLTLTTENREAKLFTGTMLAFTSWAYMHDVRFSKSEIICDASSHKPLSEKDYDNNGNLVGSYIFTDYILIPYGQTPGRIQAVIYHEKDGVDNSLEMDAEFSIVRLGVWLLKKCHSEFRGQEGGSTAQTEILTETSKSFELIDGILSRLEKTRRLMGNIKEARDGRVTVSVGSDNSLNLYARAKWSDGVNDQFQRMAKEHADFDKPVICVLPSEYVKLDNGGMQINLNIFSNIYWKRYNTEFLVELLDASGNTISKASVTDGIQAEGVPSNTQVKVEFAGINNFAAIDKVAVSATVNKMTGVYHGHGMWMTFLD